MGASDSHSAGDRYIASVVSRLCEYAGGRGLV